MDKTDIGDRMNFHEKCWKAAREVYDKNFNDLEDEQCAIIAKIVRMDEL